MNCSKTMLVARVQKWFRSIWHVFVFSVAPSRRLVDALGFQIWWDTSCVLLGIWTLLHISKRRSSLNVQATPPRIQKTLVWRFGFACVAGSPNWGYWRTKCQVSKPEEPEVEVEDEGNEEMGKKKYINGETYDEMTASYMKYHGLRDELEINPQDFEELLDNKRSHKCLRDMYRKKTIMKCLTY